MHKGVAAAALFLGLSLVPGVAQQVDLVLTPLPTVTTSGSVATPGFAATPGSAATPVGRQVDEAGGVGSRLLGQQSAAQATIAAYAARDAAQATRIASLEVALAEVQVTATALVVVAANTVLDPTRQSITIQTDLQGMLSDDSQAVAETRTALTAALSRYPANCRAGFMLISGNAQSIEEGVDLAQRVEMVLREEWPTTFTESTGAERFALPNQPPFGEVTIDIFFYSGCQPAG